MFAGYAAPFCGQLNLNQQAALYGKTTTEITYFVSNPYLKHHSAQTNNTTEFRRLRRPRHGRIHLVPSLVQIRPLICNLLGTLSLSRNPNLGTRNDQARPVCTVPRLPLLLRLLRASRERARPALLDRSLFPPPARPRIHRLAFRAELWRLSGPHVLGLHFCKQFLDHRVLVVCGSPRRNSHPDIFDSGRNRLGPHSRSQECRAVR
jgi:hypothetical protein